MMGAETTTDELVRFTLTARSRRATRSEIAENLRHLADMAESVTRIDGGFDGHLEWDMRCNPVAETEPK